MPGDNDRAYNVKTELLGGESSLTQFSRLDGGLSPQRLVLHELIAQVVSERRVLANGSDFEEALRKHTKTAQAHPTYQALERTGDYSPEKISAALDEIGLERLPLHERAEQVMMVTGGPGTGKSKIVENFADQNPEIYRNAVQIDPDHYKGLLASPDKLGMLHAEYTHEESSMIARKIVRRLDDRMAAGLPAPHVMMDVVSPNAERMAFAKKFDHMTVMTGTAPPEVTVQRAYERGFNEDGSVKGRVIATSVVLDGAAKSSRLMPNVFEHPGLDFTLINTHLTDSAKIPIVASWDNDARRLNVHDPDAFMDFVERQNINTAARSPEEIYRGMNRSPQKMAENLKSYTDKSVQIDLLKPDGDVAVSIKPGTAEIHHADLPTRRGEGFVAELAEHTGKLGKNGGVIAGVALGTLSGAFTLAAGGSKAEAAQAVYEAAVPYGETQLDLAHGNLKAAEKSATIETASNIGSLGGAAAGAAIGTMIVPGVGTFIGAGVGALSGGVGTGYLTEKVYDNYAQIKNGAIRFTHETADNLINAVQETKRFLTLRFDNKPAPDVQAAFRALPDSVTPDMPPEVTALVEVKASRTLFEKNFAEIKEHGGLSEVLAYIEANPQGAKTKTPILEEQPLYYIHGTVPSFR